jgi:hypothetical protein
MYIKAHKTVVQFKLQSREAVLTVVSSKIHEFFMHARQTRETDPHIPDKIFETHCKHPVEDSPTESDFRSIS